MGIFYLVLGIVMWVLIGYGVYRLIREIVCFVKKIILKKKGEKENENYGDQEV